MSQQHWQKAQNLETCGSGGWRPDLSGAPKAAQTRIHTQRLPWEVAGTPPPPPRRRAQGGETGREGLVQPAASPGGHRGTRGPRGLRAVGEGPRSPAVPARAEGTPTPQPPSGINGEADVGGWVRAAPATSASPPNTEPRFPSSGPALHFNPSGSPGVPLWPRQPSVSGRRPPARLTAGRGPLPRATDTG